MKSACKFKQIMHNHAFLAFIKIKKPSGPRGSPARSWWLLRGYTQKIKFFGRKCELKKQMISIITMMSLYLTSFPMHALAADSDALEKVTSNAPLTAYGVAHAYEPAADAPGENDVFAMQRAKADNIIAYPVTGGNIYFDKAIGTITDCDYSVIGVKIPAAISGVAVTGIAYDAFAYCKGIPSITIPDGVTSIGDNAFYWCTNLTNITIPNSVTRIGWNVFDGCTALTDIYYGGSKEQWNAIFGLSSSEIPSTAVIHYRSAGTGTGSGGNTGGSPQNMAYTSKQTVTVDGKPVTFQMYALKDAKGYPTNYVKLRDLAYVLNGTKAQFEVKWDGSANSVNIVKGQAYTPNGSEMSTPFSGDRAYSVNTSATKVNGTATKLNAIRLTSDTGGGYTYYKLRDLGLAIGFNVGWSSERGVYVETDKPYQG